MNDFKRYKKEVVPDIKLRGGFFLVFYFQGWIFFAFYGFLRLNGSKHGGYL